MKKVVSCSLLLLLLVALAAFASDNATTVNGWVVDEKCGVKGAHAGGEECAKKCVEKGEKIVVVTDQDKQVLSVDNPTALTDHLGHHVSIQGTLNGDKLHVNSAEMLAESADKK